MAASASAKALTKPDLEMKCHSHLPQIAITVLAVWGAISTAPTFVNTASAEPVLLLDACTRRGTDITFYILSLDGDGAEFDTVNIEARGQFLQTETDPNLFRFDQPGRTADTDFLATSTILAEGLTVIGSQDSADIFSGAFTRLGGGDLSDFNGPFAQLVFGEPVFLSSLRIAYGYRGALAFPVVDVSDAGIGIGVCAIPEPTAAATAAVASGLLLLRRRPRCG